MIFFSFFWNREFLEKHALLNFDGWKFVKSCTLKKDKHYTDPPLLINVPKKSKTFAQKSYVQCKVPGGWISRNTAPEVELSAGPILGEPAPSASHGVWIVNVFIFPHDTQQLHGGHSLPHHQGSIHNPILRNQQTSLLLSAIPSCS
jgi:hypothetical protein